MNFNTSITQAAAKAMEHITDFVFITMGNLTLAHRDQPCKERHQTRHFGGSKDSPLTDSTLFPDAIIKRAEEEIADHDSKGQSASSSSTHGKGRYHPYERSDKRSASRSEGKTETCLKEHWEETVQERQGKDCQLFLMTSQGPAVI